MTLDVARRPAEALKSGCGVIDAMQSSERVNQRVGQRGTASVRVQRPRGVRRRHDPVEVLHDVEGHIHDVLGIGREDPRNRDG